MTFKIGVLLSGCGHLDGSEIRESVLTLLAIDRAGAESVIIAPDKPQRDVINHLNQTPIPTERNILIEAARITRGKITPLSKVDWRALDALILPGGYGAAKNLSDFALKGAAATLDPELKNLILNFHQLKRPIGAICIAPAVLCLALGHLHPKLTIGNDPATAQLITQLGAVHHDCPANEAVIDDDLKIVSTPAYMYDDAAISEVAQGIDACVRAVLKLCV